ncbi:cerebellin-2-like isoform X1 [Dreissena polymorpha]|uniref:C1q domain-containing protein n=1 Tax=Dreissena polymorpha TaxID=45954 RepID=A0A9D4EKB6_DREPO|nr:cerebellin-2-like isoform X1 [Dreissena polymorpha]KAH3780914.1 hypothetical protein DPMN_158739 [Dreissena polymorpha]
MKTILSISACWFLFVFIHVEAVTDEDFQSLLARLSVLEEKQAILETENKLSQKRIAELEKYKILSDKRVASLERKNALCNRRQDDIIKKLYADKVALQTDKILPDATTTTNEYEKTLSAYDRKIATLVNEYAASPNRSGKDDSYSAAADIAVLQSKQKRFVAGGTVAFSAMKVAHQENVGIDQNIIFEQVLTNDGGGYHQNHGVFIAPQSGVYVFSSSIMCFPNGKEVLAEIVHNGNPVTRMYCQGANAHDQGSQTAVIKMNAGDEAAVRNVYRADDSIWGSLFTSFSGYSIN